MLYFFALSADEFRKVQTCEVTKEAWDILELTYEGNAIIKRSQL